MKKLAILDTDFISKGNEVRADEENSLMDRVLEVRGYSFLCHEQTEKELQKSNGNACLWLGEKIDLGQVEAYTDEKLVQEMTGVYQKAGLFQYTSLLMSACDAIDRDYFSVHYGEMKTIDHFQISTPEYLSLLKQKDEEIGEKKNLGEIKDYVLLQWLNQVNEEPAFYFCSDDRNARNGVLALEEADVRCISIVSAFQWLWKEGVFTEETAKPYTEGLMDFLRTYNQGDVRVVEASRIGRHLRVPCKQVIADIFAGKFCELPNGMLKYREEVGQRLFAANRVGGAEYEENNCYWRAIF